MRLQPQDRSQSGKTELFRSAIREKHSHPYFAREGVDPLTRAFDKKVSVHAGFGGKPLPPEDGNRHLNHLLAQPRRGQSAVYVHVPFCESHCLYCGFYSQAYHRNESMPFTDALLREIDLWQKHPAVRSGPVSAIYIGGGTPTALEAGDLERLLTGIRSAFPLTNDCEITVEGRIHNFGADKMAACLVGGANRFSIGVQTFCTDLRRAMNRIADRETVLQRLMELKDVGRAVVVIDLIYGFPGQTMAMWRHDIETFLGLEIDGADLYQLNVFPKSPLANAIDRGAVAAAADLAHQAEMFAEGVRMLNAARYRRLSMSHWGRTTRERNIYNHMMKGQSECLAYGPGAGGCLGGHFFFVESDYRAWLAAVKMRVKPLSVMIAPHPLVALDKAIAAACDLGRIDLSRLETLSRRSLLPTLTPLLDQWAMAGLIERDDPWLELTLAGQFWHVNLAQLMIDYLHRHFPEELNR